MNATADPHSVHEVQSPVAKKKPTGSKPAGNKGIRPGRNKRSLYVEVEAALREALDAVVKQERRELNTIVSMALEEFLKQRGLWPPPPAE